MDRLEIVQVTHTYPPYVGGLSHVTENLSKKMAKMGHEVTVVTLDVDGNLLRKEE
ncbi:MAG: glycosyltransferase family 1 protein, partial [Thermoprotei archaeon]